MGEYECYLFTKVIAMETLQQSAEQNTTEQRHLNTLQESRELKILANDVRALQTETNPEKVLALYKTVKAGAEQNPEVTLIFQSIQTKLEQAILETLAPSMQIGRGIPVYDNNMLRLAAAVFNGMPEKYDGEKFAKAIQATSEGNKESLRKAEAMIDSARGTKLDVKNQLPFIGQVAFKRTNTGIEPTLIRQPYYEILDGYNPATKENYRKALREAALPSNLQLARSIGGGNQSTR